jgi:putative transposase
MREYECRVARIDADITAYWMLSRMAWVATKLYNAALWYSRQVWDETGKIPSKFSLQKVVFENPQHSVLPAHTYQHAAHEVGGAYRSWFTLRKSDKAASPPGFRPKMKLSSFLFTEDAFRVDGGTLHLTIGPSLREQMKYPLKRLRTKVRWNTPLPEGGVVKQVEIVPRNGFFEAHAKILLPEPVWRADGQTVAVDLGMRNPIVSVDDTGNVDIFKGGELLSDIRYWNKEKARVQSELMVRTKGRRKWSKALERMSHHRKYQVKQGVHALTKAFTELCIKRDVKDVVVGDLGGIKRGKRWRDVQSQNWQQFPVREVVAQLGYKLARRGIRLVEQDERGTSRGRCYTCGCEDRSLLRRTHRGLFLCGNCGTRQNADINGAGNQLVRYLQAVGRTVSSSGCLAQPSVHHWNHHKWGAVQ